MAQARVYKNLNNGLWSIKQRIGGKWLVVGHAREVYLRDVSTLISEARWAHVRRGNHREVFAYMVGELQHTVGFESFRGREVVMVGGEAPAGAARVTFHPYAEDERGFHFAGVGTPYVGSQYARFTADGEVFVA